MTTGSSHPSSSPSLTPTPPVCHGTHRHHHQLPRPLVRTTADVLLRRELLHVNSEPLVESGSISTTTCTRVTSGTSPTKSTSSLTSGLSHHHRHTSPIHCHHHRLSLVRPRPPQPPKLVLLTTVVLLSTVLPHLIIGSLGNRAPPAPWGQQLLCFNRGLLLMFYMQLHKRMALSM
jgi:hypothetical protein